MADGKLVISGVESQLSMFDGILGTQQLVGSNPGALGAQAFEYSLPNMDAPASATVVNGMSNGATQGALGYRQPGNAQGTYACTWSFQQR